MLRQCSGIVPRPVVAEASITHRRVWPGHRAVHRTQLTHYRTLGLGTPAHLVARHIAPEPVLFLHSYYSLVNSKNEMHCLMTKVLLPW